MLVLLDLDNTLNDRAGAVADWAATFCTDRDLGPRALGWILATDDDGHRDRRVVFAAIRDRFGLDEPVDDLLASYRTAVQAELREVPGARRCLGRLREAGHTTIIVTNGAGAPQHHKVDALGFRDLVDGVVVSAELGVAKPEPAIFLAAAELAGLPIDEAWMVGDSAHHDVGGAQRLGLSSAWIHRGRAWDPALAPPTAIVGHLDQLPAVIDRDYESQMAP